MTMDSIENQIYFSTRNVHMRTLEQLTEKLDEVSKELKRKDIDAKRRAGLLEVKKNLTQTLAKYR